VFKRDPIAIVVIRPEGLPLARRLRKACSSWDLWMPKSADPKEDEKGYDGKFKDWLRTNVNNYEGFVCIMAAGIVVRAISPVIQDKQTGPGIVVCDEFGRQAISLLGGHEGGANELAYKVASKTGCVPVITTGTEAIKNYILGVGCKKNADYLSLKELVGKVLKKSKVDPDKVRALSTIDLKENEPCILELSKEFHWPLIIFSKNEINAANLDVKSSSFVEDNIGVPGVCEPTALMASHYGELIVSKTTEEGCAVALVREREILERRPL
jgi:cobalt-precorrin 5A hydrolase